LIHGTKLPWVVKWNSKLGVITSITGDWVMSFSSFHERHIFVVAFIALWLCCFVVVGGGPHIRHGVLVMAAWMSLGHQFSLAPPALCSLYYSLRLINQHPIGPAYRKRAWPVHHIIGWMDLYLRKRTIFGNKEKGYSLSV
jgi:hypothetical protein